jgi:hypothetical protein
MEWLEVLLDLPLESEHDTEDLKTLIAEIVIENESEFLPIIDAICSQLNNRAEYASDSFNVNQVDFVEPIRLEQGQVVGSGSLQIEFEWTAYYGCDDMDLHDEVQEAWEFDLNGQSLSFRLKLPEERVDEF